jgi:flagellar biosynthesis/type III secretory pathway protein FliH
MIIVLLLSSLAVVVGYFIGYHNGYNNGCNTGYDAGMNEGRKLMYNWMISGANKNEGWSEVDQFLKELHGK